MPTKSKVLKCISAGTITTELSVRAFSWYEILLEDAGSSKVLRY